MKKIVLASNNKGKVHEFNQLLADLDMEVLPQAEFDVPEIEETGLSFVENAILKARNAARLTGLPAIADDSGIDKAAGSARREDIGIAPELEDTRVVECGRILDMKIIAGGADLERAGIVHDHAADPVDTGAGNRGRARQVEYAGAVTLNRAGAVPAKPACQGQCHVCHVEGAAGHRERAVQCRIVDDEQIATSGQG